MGVSTHKVKNEGGKSNSREPTPATKHITSQIKWVIIQNHSQTTALPQHSTNRFYTAFSFTRNTGINNGMLIFS